MPFRAQTGRLRRKKRGLRSGASPPDRFRKPSDFMCGAGQGHDQTPHFYKRGKQHLHKNIEKHTPPPQGFGLRCPVRPFRRQLSDGPRESESLGSVPASPVCAVWPWRSERTLLCCSLWRRMMAPAAVSAFSGASAALPTTQRQLLAITARVLFLCQWMPSHSTYLTNWSCVTRVSCPPTSHIRKR